MLHFMFVDKTPTLINIYGRIGFRNRAWTCLGLYDYDFVFSKFHNIGHAAPFIERYGALWAACSGRSEHFHKCMKTAYVMTSRRKKTYLDEMTKRLAFHRQVAHAIIILTAAVRPCAPPKKTKIWLGSVRDCFCWLGYQNQYGCWH